MRVLKRGHAFRLIDFLEQVTETVVGQRFRIVVVQFVGLVELEAGLVEVVVADRIIGGTCGTIQPVLAEIQMVQVTVRLEHDGLHIECFSVRILAGNLQQVCSDNQRCRVVGVGSERRIGKFTGWLELADGQGKHGQPRSNLVGCQLPNSDPGGIKGMFQRPVRGSGLLEVATDGLVQRRHIFMERFFKGWHRRRTALQIGEILLQCHGKIEPRLAEAQVVHECPSLGVEQIGLMSVQPG